VGLRVLETVAGAGLALAVSPLLVGMAAGVPILLVISLLFWPDERTLDEVNRHICS